MNESCQVSSEEQYHGVKISLDSDNHLVLTAGLKKGGNAEAIGESSSLSCSSSSSTFLGDLHTEKSTVSIVSDYPLQNSILIDGSNNAFSFTMKVNGVIKAVDIKLTSGSYNRAGIVAEINKQLAGLGAKASLECDMQENISIDSTTNEISLVVNGVTHTITLDSPRTYTRQQLVDQINAKLSAKGVGLKATLVGKRIHYEIMVK